MNLKKKRRFQVVEYFRFTPGNRRKAEVPKIPGKRPSFEESGPLMIHQQEFRFFQKMLRLKKTVRLILFSCNAENASITSSSLKHREDKNNCVRN